MKWLAAILTALVISAPAFAGWQPFWRFMTWEPADAQFGTQFAMSDGNTHSNYLENTTGNLLNEIDKPIGAGQKVRIRGFGVSLGSPTTTVDTCDMAVGIDGVVQSWSIIKFGAGRTASANCLVAPAGGDLNVAGESCWLAAPKPYVEITWNPAANHFYRVSIGDADKADADDCADGDSVDSIQWALFIEVSDP